MRLWLIFAVLVLLPAGCVAIAPTDRTQGFRALLDEEWKYWMAEYPETATSFGFPGQDDRWTDYSQAAIDKRNARVRDTLAKLKAISRKELDAHDQLNYDLYLEMIESASRGLDFNNDALPIRGVIPHNLSMPINQLEGIQQDVPRTIALMPAATETDYRHIVRRLGGISVLVDQTIALMQQGLQKGLTPPAITFRDVPAQVDAQVVADPMKSPLLEAFTTWPATIPEATRASLTAAAKDAYEKSIKPAFSKLHDFLVKTYLPGCRETTSAAALPQGGDLYAYNVRWHTTTPKTPQEIHQIGLAEVARLRTAMDQVMAEAQFTGSFDDFKKFLRTSPQFYFKDAASLVSAYRDVAKRADPELAHLFGHLPQNQYGVVPVPDAVAPSQTTAYYEPGAFAVGRPGHMFANTYKLDSRPRWEMEALTLHEAVPGHHTQISIAQELTGLAEFRKNTSYTAYVEGWALYSEGLGYEMGFYRDPYSRFGQLTYEMWRAVRLVVDTGLHAMNWTRQQAIDYFLANAAKTEQDITVEVDRYIVWPGQALGYKMGQLKIRELRTHAEQELGAKFDVRAFHDVILGRGAVPLDVLEQQVNAWIAQVKSGASAPR
jgi:uncharacterized protein (DUF885 family)